MIRKSGQMGVPVIDIDGQIVIGFDVPKLESLLAQRAASGVRFGLSVADAAAVARKLLPLDKILGVSTTTAELAVEAQADGADYIAVGAMYPTPTKDTAKVVGLERLRKVRRAINLPLVAIGGINQDNAAKVMAAGASAVAVISAILHTNNIEEATRQFVAKLKTVK